MGVRSKSVKSQRMVTCQIRQNGLPSVRIITPTSPAIAFRTSTSCYLHPKFPVLRTAFPGNTGADLGPRGRPCPPSATPPGRFFAKSTTPPEAQLSNLGHHFSSQNCSSQTALASETPTTWQFSELQATEDLRCTFCVLNVNACSLSSSAVLRSVI